MFGQRRQQRKTKEVRRLLPQQNEEKRITIPERLMCRLPEERQEEIHCQIRVQRLVKRLSLECKEQSDFFSGIRHFSPEVYLENDPTEDPVIDLSCAVQNSLEMATQQLMQTNEDNQCTLTLLSAITFLGRDGRSLATYLGGTGHTSMQLWLKARKHWAPPRTGDLRDMPLGLDSPGSTEARIRWMKDHFLLVRRWEYKNMWDKASFNACMSREGHAKVDSWEDIKTFLADFATLEPPGVWPPPSITHKLPWLIASTKQTVGRGCNPTGNVVWPEVTACPSLYGLGFVCWGGANFPNDAKEKNELLTLELSAEENSMVTCLFLDAQFAMEDDDDTMEKVVRIDGGGKAFFDKRALFLLDDTDHDGGKAFLKDDMVALVLRLLEMADDEKRTNPDYIPCLFQTPLFTNQLRRRGYRSVATWTQTIRKRRNIGSLFACRLLFLPFNVMKHWWMVVVDIQNRRIYSYDSLHAIGYSMLSQTMDYIVGEYKMEFGVDMTCDEVEKWEQVIGVGPHQHNGYDCGVFTLLCADYIWSGFETHYNQLVATAYRRKLGLLFAKQKDFSVSRRKSDGKPRPSA